MRETDVANALHALGGCNAIVTSAMIVDWAHYSGCYEIHDYNQTTRFNQMKHVTRIFRSWIAYGYLEKVFVVGVGSVNIVYYRVLEIPNIKDCTVNDF